MYESQGPPAPAYKNALRSSSPAATSAAACCVGSPMKDFRISSRFTAMFFILSMAPVSGLSAAAPTGRGTGVQIQA